MSLTDAPTVAVEPPAPPLPRRGVSALLGWWYATYFAALGGLGPLGQAVFAAATQGATAIVGTLLAGLLFDTLGPNGVFEVTAAFTVAAALARGLGRPAGPTGACRHPWRAHG